MRLDEIFETELCPRCGGTGHHSRCEMWGTICFRCEGRKHAFTKRDTPLVNDFQQAKARACKAQAQDLRPETALPIRGRAKVPRQKRKDASPVD